jgi:hypothetical protein
MSGRRARRVSKRGDMGKTIAVSVSLVELGLLGCQGASAGAADETAVVCTLIFEPRAGAAP